MFKVIILLLMYPEKEPQMVDDIILPLGNDKISLQGLVSVRRSIEFVTCNDAPESMTQFDTAIESVGFSLAFTEGLIVDEGKVPASDVMQPMNEESFEL